MLLYVFLVLGAWKGVLGEDDVCDKELDEVCVLRSFRFPGTEAEIEQLCPQVLQDIYCMNDYTSNCKSESDLKQKYRQDYKALVEEVCRKDSQIRRSIAENIACLREMVLNDFQACDEFLREKNEAMMKRMYSIATERGYGEGILDQNLWAPYECLGNSLKVVCFAAQTSARCGSDTKDLVLELVRKSGFQELYCAPAGEERLVEYITLLELELEEETALNRILGNE